MTFIEAIQADWIFYVVNLLAFVTVVLCTYLYAKSKQAQAVAAVQAELQQVQLQYTDKLLDKEEALKKKKERVRLILKDLDNQMRNKDVAMLQARRNELSNVFVMEYAAAMQQYAHLGHQFYELNVDKYHSFVRNEIFPFLDTSRKILMAINAPKVIQTIGTELAPAISYSYQDFDFAFDMIRKYPTSEFNREMQQYLPALGFSKKDLD